MTIHIYVNKQEVAITQADVSVETIVTAWNELHQADGMTMTGTPSIDYECDGYFGILLPGDTIQVKDGDAFNVDPYHNS